MGVLGQKMTLASSNATLQLIHVHMVSKSPHSPSKTAIYICVLRYIYPQKEKKKKKGKEFEKKTSKV